MLAVPGERQSTGHVPVLLGTFLKNISPVTGCWIDGTLGAGGYTRALLDSGAERVIALDRDPECLKLAESWAPHYGVRLTLVEDNFRRLDEIAARHGASSVDGVVLDVGLSSMQLDAAGRGFSFARDGPLDMRMSGTGVSAADIVNTASESSLAKILRQYGEERSSRRIARHIVASRQRSPIRTTAELASLIASGGARRGKRGQHPATRSFQALRIVVNEELVNLAAGLAAAERVLRTGGLLAVISFHSLEDRLVKTFLRGEAKAGTANRHAPPVNPRPRPARFEMVGRKALKAGGREVAENPRARSACLRIARRSGADPGLSVTSGTALLAMLGVPAIDPGEVL